MGDQRVSDVEHCTVCVQLKQPQARAAHTPTPCLSAVRDAAHHHRPHMSAPTTAAGINSRSWTRRRWSHMTFRSLLLLLLLSMKCLRGWHDHHLHDRRLCAAAGPQALSASPSQIRCRRWQWRWWWQRQQLTKERGQQAGFPRTNIPTHAQELPRLQLQLNAVQREAPANTLCEVQVAALTLAHCPSLTSLPLLARNACRRTSSGSNRLPCASRSSTTPRSHQHHMA
jgi:hypothetical protein